MHAAFPEATDQQIYLWQKVYYRFFCQLIAEFIKSVSADKMFFDKTVSVPNEWLKVIEKYRSEGRNIVILTGHYGNWEWAAARLSAIKGYKKFVIYRQQSLGMADNLMIKIREKGESILLPEQQIRTALSYAREQPTMIIMAADQSPVNTQACHWVNFLGINTPFHPGPARIAHMIDAIVFYVAVLPVKRGEYKIEITDISNTSSIADGQEHLTINYAAALEKDIRNMPPYWLWSHRRWKRAGLPGLYE